MQFDDEVNIKPAFVNYSDVTGYKGFVTAEAIASAGVACVSANIPAIFSDNSKKTFAIGVAALGGAATGFTTEVFKQYELAYKRVKQQGKNPGMTDVLSEIEWKPVIVNSAVNGMITAASTWMVTSPKFEKVASKIKSKFGDYFVKDTQKFINVLKIYLRYNKLGSEFLKLSPEARKTFYEDFIAKTDDNILQAFEDNVALVDAWRIVRYCGDPKFETKAVELAELKNVATHLDEIIKAGGYKVWKTDDLFFDVLSKPDFRAFRSLYKNNPKISVELVDAEWHTFVTQAKSTYNIASKRNIAKVEFQGQQKLIASGTKYTGQMKGKFIPEEFVQKINNGEGVFKPTIWTRRVDTESIGLEYFASQRGAVAGQKYPEVTGEIKIISDLCPCPSCAAIFQQFIEMFPNVEIKIVTSSKLHYD